MTDEKITCWVDTKISLVGAVSEEGQDAINQVILASKNTELKSAGAGFRLDEFNFFNQEWLDKLHSIGLDPRKAIVFVNQPGVEYFPHVDHGCVGLNWCFCDDPNHKMIWYTVKPGKGPIDDPAVMPQFDYTKYYEKDLDRIDEKHITGDYATLVRTDIPHLMELNSQRVTISVRFGRHKNFRSYEKAVEFLDGLSNE